jgi:hypothetical protein
MQAAKNQKIFLNNEKAKIDNSKIEQANQSSPIVFQVPTSFGSRSCDQVMWFLPRIMNTSLISATTDQMGNSLSSMPSPYDVFSSMKRLIYIIGRKSVTTASTSTEGE